jgi:hypothetical protein
MHLSFISLFTLPFTASFLLHVSSPTKAGWCLKVECLLLGYSSMLQDVVTEKAWFINSLRAELHYNVSA